MTQFHRFCQCCGSGSGGSVINLHLGSGFGSVRKSESRLHVSRSKRKISTDPQHWFFRRTMLISTLYQIFLPGSHCWPGRGRGTASVGSGPGPPVRPRPPDLSVPSRQGQKVHRREKIYRLKVNIAN
jgi:hypothetical protein